MIKCNKCNSTKWVEVTDGAVLRTSLEFDADEQKYKVTDKSNEYGEVYVECYDCGLRASQEQEDAVINSLLGMETKANEN
jgi:hypothetical protein